LNVMRNGEGYHDPTAGVAIGNAFVPTVGHIYTNGSNPGYVVPLKIYEQVAVGYKLDTSIPYSSDYIIEVDNYMVDPRKVINIVTSRLGEDLGPLSPDDTKMLLEQLAKFCGGEFIPVDTASELSTAREKAQKYQSLYESTSAELEIANEEIERLRAELEMKKKLPVVLDEVFEPHECKVKPIPVDLIKANAERDVYKRLYEELLEKMLKGGA